MKSNQYFLDDIKSILLTIITIPCIWIFFLKWAPDTMIPTHDGMAINYPFISIFQERSGSINDSMYAARLKGGSEIFEIVNLNYALETMAKLGFSTQTIINFQIFFIQFLYAILGLIISRCLTSKNLEKPVFLKSSEKIMAIIIIAFSPILGWRFSVGHEVLVIGALTFLTGVTLLCLCLTDSWSCISVATTIGSLILALECVGQQMVCYSLFFGAPIFVGLISSGLRIEYIKKRSLVLTCLIIVTSLLISLPKFLPFFMHAFGIDSLRKIGSQILTYSYTTGNLENWLNSLFWSRNAIPLVINVNFHHEIHYAIGPIAFLVILLPFKKNANLILGTSISIMMVLLFSMNISPISDLFLSLFPILKSFRVPERSVFSVGLVIPILTIVAYLTQIHADSKKLNAKYYLVIIFIFAIFFVFPRPIQEGLCWILTAALVTAKFMAQQRVRQIFLFALPIFTAGSISFFNEKFYPFVRETDFATPIKELGQELKNSNPTLTNPLTRVSLLSQSRAFGPNTAFMAGLSSIDGYWFQTNRFTYVIAALENRAIMPTENFHYFPPSHNSFNILQQLYNIQYLIEPTASAFKIEPLPDTNGAAWFTEKINFLKNYEELNLTLRNTADLKSMLKANAYIIPSDPFFEYKKITPSSDDNCSKSITTDIKPNLFDQSLLISVKSFGFCALVVSTNFVSSLNAKVVNGPIAGQNLHVFPVNGSLTGIIIPPQAEKILLSPTLPEYPFAQALHYLGIILFILILVLVEKDKPKKSNFFTRLYF